MSYTLTQKLRELTPYDPIEGEYAIRLDANESYFNINELLSDKISKAISSIELNRYPDPCATKTIKAFAEFYGLEENLVTAGNGSDELISIISSCFLEKGDKVVCLTPDFSMYAFYGSLYELETIKLQKEYDLSINVDKLINLCNEQKPKMLIFSNPCNPTSLGIMRDDVLKILDNLNCLVVLDEAYMDFWTESILDKINDYDNLIILKTCSKGIGLAGIRFGFAVAGEKITNALKAAKSPYNTDAVSQKIVEIVFGEKDILTSKISEIIENRESLLISLISLKDKYNKIEEVYDSKTNFVFIKTNFYEEIFKGLLDKSIAVRKFNCFLRINTGTEFENQKLLEALEDILKKLN